MKKIINGLFGLVVVLTATGAFLPVKARAQDLTTVTGEEGVHVMPLPAQAAANAQFDALQALGTPALVYHGGPVMTTVTTYAIFWAPSTLQNGHSTSLPASYQTIQSDFLRAYPGHGIADNNTQYYMTTGSSTTQVHTYVRNVGAFGGSYVDTSAYPASGCSDSVTPGDCVTDAQIQAEVKKVMALKGWTGGLSHMFFVYTSSGEGSCSGTSCAYTQYCAYHGYFLSGSTPVVYANEPYAAAGYCQGGTSPNGNLAADSAASITSHELTEAITDPELNAWYSSTGQEIGDLCAWNYGSNTWLSGKANQYWPISYTGTNLFGTGFELQQEYNNHTASCVQVGP